MKTYPKQLETGLCERIRREEAQFSSKNRETDTLWGHLERVANLAERIGDSEGLDKASCRLVGLFHDAGKFVAGTYHHNDSIEEEQSVTVLKEFANKHGLDSALVDAVSDAILQLYRDDPDPEPLAQVLFDADNLDKLGLVGVANFFVKSGLRGRGVSKELLYSLTIELTYARHAEKCMMTATGRKLAKKKAKDTVFYINHLLASLREDGLFDFNVKQITFDGLVLDVVSPVVCECGGKLNICHWGKEGLKCYEIHLEHSCKQCEATHELRFCRPRLVS